VSLEGRVPADHPVRMLRRLVDLILGELDGVFAERYSPDGRPSIPPELTCPPPAPENGRCTGLVDAHLKESGYPRRGQGL